ncbi:MAG: methionine--tRNA ligase [bacterium]|nr:methionine--tRNA ligase [bacterium]
MKTFTITTSIAYTNANPHVGFALELIQADVLARSRRQKGDTVFFLTGTDEHGSKIARAANLAGKDPQIFVNEISGKFQELSQALSISNSAFIRTTDREKHWPGVRKLFIKLQENGDIYKKEYEGLYCAGCEAFVTEKDLQDGLCPIHKKEPEMIKEENYFFRLSRYGEEIVRALREGRMRIVPEHRTNEVLNFIEQGLEDISFSRSKEALSWGIPVPGDESQVLYVWGDALTNYISALDYENEGEKFKTFWPADVQCIGKDILRFHAVIWPAMLLSAGVDLPKTIFVHGFLTVDGQKMSKSIGNVIDPFELVEKYGVDAVRYFFLREVPPTEDGDFSYQKFEARYNADLAGGLGNLLSRVLTMAEKQGVKAKGEVKDKETKEKVEQVREAVDIALNDFRFHDALAVIWELVTHADRLVDRERPWEGKEGSSTVLADLLLVLKELSDMLGPFLPQASQEIQEQLAGKKRKSLFSRIA